MSTTMQQPWEEDLDFPEPPNLPEPDLEPDLEFPEPEPPQPQPQERQSKPHQHQAQPQRQSSQRSYDKKQEQDKDAPMSSYAYDTYCKMPDDLSCFKTIVIPSACLCCNNSAFTLYVDKSYRKQIECFCRLKHTIVDYTIVMSCDGAEQQSKVIADCINAAIKYNDTEQQRIQAAFR